MPSSIYRPLSTAASAVVLPFRQFAPPRPLFGHLAAALAFLLGVSAPAQAVHLDVEIWGDGDSMAAGFCRTPGAVGCDLAQLVAGLNLPPNTLPIEGATGKMVFLSDFRDFSGGPNKTPNPGFQAVQNMLNPGELVRYRATGKLRYWGSTVGAWADAPGNVRIKLAGGIDPATVITDYNQCGGQLFCFAPGSSGQESFTFFTGSGIGGKAEMIVDAANSQGSLHTHLNFFLESAVGVAGGPIGAYLLELKVLSNQRSLASDPLYVLFNAGLSAADYSAALLDLVDTLPPPPPPPPQQPPVANAGADRLVRLNSSVTLDGNASRDPQPGPNPLGYAWQQTQGPTVTLVGAATATPRFLPLQTGNYTFKLTVNDGANPGYDEVTFSVPVLGDVDLDGDIDRIDIALILAAASNAPHAAANDVRDLDGNNLINAQDAKLAQARCTLRLCYPSRR